MRLHYTRDYRRLELISGVPRYLTALAVSGGALYLLLRAVTSGAPPLFYGVVLGFALFAGVLVASVGLFVGRLMRNTLTVTEGGITFHAWLNFTLRATWEQARPLEARPQRGSPAIVLVLPEATLEQTPLTRRFRRQPLEAPYVLVVSRFEGWQSAFSQAAPPHILEEIDDHLPG